MQAARQKKKTTTPKVLRKIPRMSTSSETEGRIYFSLRYACLFSAIRDAFLLQTKLKVIEVHQKKSLQAWWLILDFVSDRQATHFQCRLCCLSKTQDSASPWGHRLGLWTHWLIRLGTHKLPSSEGDTARAPRRSWPGSSTPRRPPFSPVEISEEIFSEAFQRSDTSHRQQNSKRLRGWR